MELADCQEYLLLITHGKLKAEETRCDRKELHSELPT